MTLFINKIINRPNVAGKGEWRYLTVQINWSDQIIGSNWIRKANPERPTVGRVLPTVGHGLPTVGRLRTLAQNVRIFIAWLLGKSLVGPTDHIIKMHKICRKTASYYCLGKRIFRLNISVTTDKYFHTSNIICFCKSVIVSTLVAGVLLKTHFYIINNSLKVPSHDFFLLSQ